MIGTISRGYGAAVVAASLAVAGCGHRHSDSQSPGSNTASTAAASAAKKIDTEAEIQAARAALNPEDRALVEAQQSCAVMADSRLGSMGTPLKVMLKDQPVFVCCKGCVKKAEREADKTLARVAELKAKAKSEAPKP